MNKFENDIETFLKNYSEQVQLISHKLREIIKVNLIEIQEQLDLSAKMIAYSYGNKYSQMICTIIPSKNGVKLGFSRGVDLNDPDNVLKGNGKISRYIQFYSIEDLNIVVINQFLNNAYQIYYKLIDIK